MGDDFPKFVLQLLRPQQGDRRVRIPIVPDQRESLFVDEGTCAPLSVSLEYRKHFLLPAWVRVDLTAPFIGTVRMKAPCSATRPTADPQTTCPGNPVRDR